MTKSASESCKKEKESYLYRLAIERITALRSFAFFYKRGHKKGPAHHIRRNHFQVGVVLITYFCCCCCGNQLSCWSALL
jgi:hypothetical protein